MADNRVNSMNLSSLSNSDRVRLPPPGVIDAGGSAHLLSPKWIILILTLAEGERNSPVGFILKTVVQDEQHIFISIVG
jgi:hypothetical protein